MYSAKVMIFVKKNKAQNSRKAILQAINTPVRDKKLSKIVV